LYEYAIEYYEQALSIDPQCSVTQDNLAYCYQQLGITQR